MPRIRVTFKFSFRGYPFEGQKLLWNTQLEVTSELLAPDLGEGLSLAICCRMLLILVAPTGIEPVLSALKGPRVNQLHHGAEGFDKWIDFGSVTGARTRTLRLERATC